MTAIGDALKSRAIVGAIFLEVMLEAEDGGPQRAFSGKGSYTDPLGRLWTGAGGVGRISPVQTAEGVSASAFSVGFDVSRTQANDAAFADLVEAVKADRRTPVRGKRVHAYLGVFDRVTGALVGGQLQQWATGVGSHLTTSWSRERLAMTLHCEPLIGGIWPSKGRHLTHEDQQLIHPGDMGLEFVSIIASGGRNVTWNPGV